MPPAPSRLARSLLPTVALLSTTLAHAAAAQERPDSVSLRFGWRAGTTARVEQEWSRTQRSATRTDSVGVASSYRLRVLPHPEGLLVHVDSFVLQGPAGQPAPTRDAGDAAAQRVLAQLTGLQPSYVVSTVGEFVRVENTAPLRALLDSLTAPLRAQIDTMPAAARAMLDNLISPQAVTASAMQEWNLLVGTWLGADWVVGDAYELTADEPVPVLPGVTIPMSYTFAATERVPCTATATARACVELVMVSEPDSAGMRRVMADVISRFGAEAQEVMRALGSVRAENELRVVAEPGTLRPHRVELVRVVEARAVEADGAEQATRRVDVRRARYHYLP